MRIEIRNDSVVLDGYVNKTDSYSRILPSPRGRFKEKIIPKTFERALMKAKNVDLLFNHDRNKRLGSTQEGNLELREDNIGLRAIATVSDPEIIEKARNGELRGWSWGMFVMKDTWEDGSDGIQKRMVEDMDLVEVSILDRTPAYVGTSIESRGNEELVNEHRSEEFTAIIEDKTEEKEEDNQEETRDHIDPFYFDHLDNELTILQLKGSLNR
jgi:Escherichia/Staphylococcus phage prohead protease